MKRSALTILLLAGSFNLFAQQAKIKAMAQQMAEATVKGDYKTVIEHTDPETIKKAGGKEAMAKAVGTMFAQLKKTGMSIRAASAGEPGKIVIAGDRQFCLVPESVTMNVPASNMMPKGSYSVQSSLLAVSSDKGKTWYFTNSGNMTDEALYQIYPELKGKISMPKPTAPKFTPEA